MLSEYAADKLQQLQQPTALASCKIEEDLELFRIVSVIITVVKTNQGTCMCMVLKLK